jgi:hypothetical protein
VAGTARRWFPSWWKRRPRPCCEISALQLAAAVLAAENHPAALEFVCLDSRLGVAAQREGFPVRGIG